MKKHILVGLALVLAAVLPALTVAQYDDPELDLAVTWMHNNNMTRYADAETYHPELWVSREQAARLLGQYALEVKGMEQSDTFNCDFTDIGEADSTLTAYIISACETGIFKGSHGMFLPKGNLTKAQAVTVLVRIIAGDQDETATPRRQNYFTRAQQADITTETDVWALNRPVTRYELALMLYRAEHGRTSPEQLEMAEVKQLLLELGLRTQ